MWQNRSMILPLNEYTLSKGIVSLKLSKKTRKLWTRKLGIVITIHFLWLGESWYHCHASSMIQVSINVCCLHHIWRANFYTFFCTKPLGSSLSPSHLFSPHFFSVLCFLCSFCLLFTFFPFFLFSFYINSCFFCLHFPFCSPPYSFFHFIFLRSLFRCLYSILLFPFFVLLRTSLLFLLLSFYSSRVTVASPIPKILCSSCPLTAVCGREDPRDISSLILFPSSLFDFYFTFSP